MKDFFRVISEEAIMGILAFHRSGGECVYVNSLAREMLEIPVRNGESADVIELNVKDLFEESDRPGLARAFKAELLQHEGLYQDVLIRKKNGHVMIANAGVKHIATESEEPLFLVMFQDVTVQKKLQREIHAKQDEIQKAFLELMEQNRQLKELDHAKDRFLALTTHELRTPLSAIVATAEVLELKLYESPEQKEQFIVTIREQAEHLMEIVNDILDFAKIRAGKMEFYVEQVALAPILSKSCSNYEQMAGASGVKIQMIQPKDPEICAWTDVLRIREVINNVVNNAIKYNRKNGIVTIALEQIEGKVRIGVTDTGLGIPADKQQHVFNEFETVENVSRHHKGTGLGMPISRRLMQSMGGDLTFESEVGKGTTFFIDVPSEKVLPEEFYRSRQELDGDLAA